MLSDILANVIANFVFWAVLGIVVGVAARTAQRRFRRFFGLHTNQQLATCLSNLWTSSASKRPVGYTLSLHELKASEAITRLFSSAPFRLPDLVRGLVDAVYLGGNRYDFRTVVSPAPGEDPTSCAELGSNLVVAGSATRNSIRRLYLDEELVCLRVANEGPDVEKHQPPPEDRYVEVLRGPNTGRRVVAEHMELAVVEKAYDTARGTTVIFCLGVQGDTTWAATEYLARNWRKLQREFGDGPFALCLAFHNPRYDYAYRPPRRLLAVPG